MKSRKFVVAASLFVFTLLSIPALPILVILGMSAYGELDEWRFDAPDEFSQTKWQSNLKYRWVSIDRLREEELRPGMRKAAVAALLGPPDTVTAEGDWQYEAKRPGWRLIDFSGGGLRVAFGADSRAHSFEDTRWVD